MQSDPGPVRRSIWFPQSGARSRTAASFGLLGLLLFAGFAWHATQAAREEGSRASEALLAQVASTLANRLDADMAERFRDVTHLSSIGAALGDTLTPADWRALLEQVQHALQDYSWIGVADRQGTVVAATGGLLEGRDVSSRPWFAQGRERPVVLDVHEAVLLAGLLPPPAADEPLRFVDVAAPLEGRQGARQGVIGAHLNWQWAAARLRAALDQFDAALGLRARLLDREGRVLLSSDSRAAPSLAEADYLSARHAAVPMPPYPGLGWSVVVQQPLQVAHAGADRLQRQLFTLALGGAALFTVLGWWLAGVLTSSLRAAAHQARAFAPTGSHADHPDEVTRLSASMATLAANLREREDALTELNRSLDDRIQQRTSGLADRNEQLMVFRRSISHDLRGPLGQMALLLNHLVEREGAGFPADARRKIRVVAAECERLSQLTDDMLSLAAVEERALAWQRVDHAAMVRHVVSQLEAAWPGPRPEVHIASLPETHGDEAMLRQVWANLLSNAFKYSRHAAQPRIDVDASVDGDEAVFTVTDNGAGFDPTQAERLFGAFQRLHRHDEFEGTGLGLNIVLRIVQRHGGRVWAEGRPGEGARFHVALPMHGPAAADTSRPLRPAAP